MRMTRRGVVTALCSLLLAICLGCDGAKPEPVTITFMDPEWSHDRSPRSLLSEVNLREFQTQTGIRVVHLPTPETSQQQLNLMRGLLRNQGSNPDVYGVDVAWAGLLDDELLDLTPFFASELLRENKDYFLAIR